MLQRTKDSFIRLMEDTDLLPVPGKALLVCKGNEEVFRYYQGEARPETLYRVHSMTKLFTVTAALQLLEQGRFLMEDPVSMYLPEYFMRPAKQKKLKQKSIIVHLPSDSVVSTFIDL